MLLNVFLHYGVACIPVLLAKGIHSIIEFIEGWVTDMTELVVDGCSLFTEGRGEVGEID